MEQHGTWLNDPRLRKYVDGGLDENGELWAGLEIQRINEAIDADEFGERGEDIAVLCFVMSLYGNFPISLRYTCENLSKENLARILKALYLAYGYPEPN